MITWSKYQEAIFDAYENTRKNIFIEATAGSAKTTVIVECCKRTPPGKTAAFLAFNKSIAEELRSRVPSHITVSTAHAMGLKILFANFKFHMKLVDNKGFMMARKLLDVNDIPVKQQVRYAFELQDIWNACRSGLLVGNSIDIQEICLEKEIEYRDRMVSDIKIIAEEWERKALRIDGKKDFEMDFTDMIYLPYLLLEPKDFPKFDIVFTDEFQDSSPLIQELMLMYVKPRFGRFVVVGDRAQCQPAGTKILMDNGEEKNIEDVKIGDKVVSYEYRHDACFAGDFSRKYALNSDYERLHKESPYIVSGIAKRNYEGFLFELEAENGKKSRYTEGHICYVRWRPEIENKYVLYLMKRGDWFRIGISPYTKLSTKTSGGFLSRFRSEDADCAWILKLYDTKEEARLDEMYYSYKYGIPQTVFKFSDWKTCLDQNSLDSFYERFEGSLQSNAIALLEFFGRKLEYPFLFEDSNKDSRWKTGIKYMFNIFACNIFPELMQVAIYDRDNRPTTSSSYKSRAKPVYKNIVKWDKIFYTEPVYSLKVEVNQNYIADGILTHNCLYNFMNADLNCFLSMAKKENTIVLPLSVSYRCSKAVVAEANKIFPNSIQATDQAAEGAVLRGDVFDAKEGEFVLCRNNMPLVEAFIGFLEKKKKAAIKGKDFGDALISIIDKIYKIDDLDVLKLAKLESLMAKGIPEAIAKNMPAYINLEEKCMIIERLYDIWPNILELKSHIDTIFTDKTEGVILSTIHKSKGLESNRVFFLNPQLIPSPHATTEDALYSEKCLKFVAITRAKKELIYCNL